MESETYMFSPKLSNPSFLFCNKHRSPGSAERGPILLHKEDTLIRPICCVWGGPPTQGAPSVSLSRDLKTTGVSPREPNYCSLTSTTDSRFLRRETLSSQMLPWKLRVKAKYNLQ